jgi:succinate dehydrogenase/fumarate reductase cytochrome b subunit
MLAQAQQKIWNIYQQLNRSQKLYLIGCVLALNTLFWNLTPFNDLFKTSLVLLSLFWAGGITSDFLYFYHKVWGTTLGKVALVTLYALLTNITYGFADQLVNLIIGYESSGLNRVTNFVAIMIIPIVFFLVTFIVFLLLILLCQFYVVYVIWTKEKGNTKENYSGWTCAARFLIYPFIFTLLFTFGDKYKDKYSNFISEKAKSYIYDFEAKKHSRCVTPDGTKVITISSDEIILVTKKDDKYSFVPMLCDPILKKL